MPRVSRVVTEKNRAAIERESARLFREQGLRGVSVAELMAAAGLTHGVSTATLSLRMRLPQSRAPRRSTKPSSAGKRGFPRQPIVSRR